MEMIRTSEYSFTYRGQVLPAIQNVNISIKKGEVVLVAGNSGSGKTTFLRSLNGLIPEITEGSLEGHRYLTGTDMRNLPIYEISRRLGSVFQNPRSQFFTLEVISELVFAMENFGFSRKQMGDRINEIKELLPVGPLLDKTIAQLSSGERQVLALASAMTLGPDVLLFDEPSANLDYRNAMKLKRILQKMKTQGKTILIADHRFFYMDGLVDKVILFDNRKAKMFNSEKAFRTSSYPTRSFNIFQMEFREHRREAHLGETVVNVENVSKWNVLRELSFSLRGGEVAVMVGANGAGKTTLSKLMTGTLKPDNGMVTCSNQPFSVMQDADFQLFGTSVLNELEVGKKALSEEKKQQVLTRLGLWELRNTHPFDLSGGEKQRLQIAVASTQDSDLIIFDEPTSGLDVKSMELVTREIKDLSKNKAVFVISHDYEFICAVADRVLYLKDGKINRDFGLNPDTVSVLKEIFVDMEDENE